MVVGKLHIIRLETKINCKTDTAMAYGIPFSTLLLYFKKINSTQQQALHGCDILKHMRIHRAKHGNMENELFDWLFHAPKKKKKKKKPIRLWMAKY